MSKMSGYVRLLRKTSAIFTFAGSFGEPAGHGERSKNAQMLA